MIPRTHRDSFADPRLTIGERLCLALLWHHADDQCQCWPSIGTIAKMSGASTRTVERWLARLSELGHLRRSWTGHKSITTTITVVDATDASVGTPRRPRRMIPRSPPTPVSVHTDAGVGSLPTPTSDKRHEHHRTPDPERGTPPRPPPRVVPQGGRSDHESKAASVPSKSDRGQGDPEMLVLTPPPADPDQRDPVRSIIEAHNRYKPRHGSALVKTPPGIIEAIATHGVRDLALLLEGIWLLDQLQPDGGMGQWYGARMYKGGSLAIYSDQVLRGTCARPSRTNRLSGNATPASMADAVARLRERLADRRRADLEADKRRSDRDPGDDDLAF